MSRSGRILITGADGYLGRVLARRFLAATDDPLLLTVRAQNQDALEAKRAFLVTQLGDFGKRVILRACDLTCTNDFEAIETEGIRAIVHAAAVTRFNVERDLAQRTNVEGTESVLRFAERCPALEAFVLLGTLYASGLQAGSLREVPFDGEMGFANHYEWSKWQAETVLLRRHDHLPWQICRLATVIADNDGGTVVQRNAFHNSLRVYHHGLLSLVPGLPETPLYFITGDFAADAIVSAMSRGRRRTIYHLSHRKEDTVMLGEMIAIAFAQFDKDPNFRRKRILPPLFVNLESFRSLSGAVSGLAGELVRQAAAGITPFAPQLFVSKEIANDNLVMAYPEYAAPDARRLIGDTCSHLLRVQWNGEARRAA